MVLEEQSMSAGPKTDETLHVDVQWHGLVDYDEGLKLQAAAIGPRQETRHRDRLLLLEHPPTYTLGRRERPEHIVLSAEARRKEGIALRRTDRGGDVTYHGPGQLVGYPILDLKRLYRARGLARPDLHLYLREIEEVVIKTLGNLGLRGWQYEGYTGVWVDGPAGPQKIAAIGVKVNSRGISSHGFALNVNPNLAHFRGIVPCGIEEHGVTSMAQHLGHEIAVTDVLEPLVASFSAVFNVEAPFVTAPQTT